MIKGCPNLSAFPLNTTTHTDLVSMFAGCTDTFEYALTTITPTDITGILKACANPPAYPPIRNVGH